MKRNRNHPHFQGISATPKVQNCGVCNIERKLKYASYAQAEIALRECMKKAEYELAIYGFTNRNERSVYSCDFCKCWHLTSQEKFSRL